MPHLARGQKEKEEFVCMLRVSSQVVSDLPGKSADSGGASGVAVGWRKVKIKGNGDVLLRGNNEEELERQSKAPEYFLWLAK